MIQRRLQSQCDRRLKRNAKRLKKRGMLNSSSRGTNHVSLLWSGLDHVLDPVRMAQRRTVIERRDRLWSFAFITIAFLVILVDYILT